MKEMLREVAILSFGTTAVFDFQMGTKRPFLTRSLKITPKLVLERLVSKFSYWYIKKET